MRYKLWKIQEIWEKINTEMVAEDIKEVMQYLFPALWLAVGLFAAFCLLLYLIKRRMPRSPILLFLFFWNNSMMAYISILCRPPGSRDRVDWTLFEFLNRGPSAMAYAVENVLFFIPFGFLLSLLLQKSERGQKSFSENNFWFLKSVFCGMMVSIIIEGTQFITKCGFVQAEDVMMNTVGTVVGCILAAGWWLVGVSLKRLKIED
ncbi:MAG: VanZ family protein [bacterium]|nr:VanZ family protein [bacterium]